MLRMLAPLLHGFASMTLVAMVAAATWAASTTKIRPDAIADLVQRMFG